MLQTQRDYEFMMPAAAGKHTKQLARLARRWLNDFRWDKRGDVLPARKNQLMEDSSRGRRFLMFQKRDYDS
jgi:hypothetical protein